MRIERLASLMSAAALVAGMLIAERVNTEPVQFAALSLLTLLLWRASAMPLLAMGAGALFGVLAASHPRADAADCLAALCGVLATGAVLFLRRRAECAESSPR